MRERTNRPSRLLALSVLALGVSACGRERAPEDPDPGPSTASPVRAEPASDAASAREAPLERAIGLTFGLPLPVGLELVERDEDVARFRSPHALAALVAFYDRELREHTRTDAPDGTMYERDAADATAVYLVEREDGREVFYVQGAADLSVFGLSALAGETLPPRERPRGLRAPPEVVERLRAQRAPERPTGGGGDFYDERFEEVEGEQVRVLTLREHSEDSLLDGPHQPIEAWDGRSPRLPRRPGGSYDRGDSQRSLRPTPQVDAEGNPLPFAGSQRVSIDPSDYPH